MAVALAPSTTDAQTDVAQSWEFRAGDEIAHGRTALKLLGGGRRYEAYLAYDETLMTTVVVKILRPSKVADRGPLEGLAEEYDSLRAANHPSICRGFDAVLGGPRPHIVLEHVQGPRLSTLLRRFGRLDLDQLIPLAVEVCAALHYLHGRQMLHLDVKPQNIIMSGPPRLIDLSVACSFDVARGLRSPVGTDAYMAPEQAAPQAGVPVGPPADIWGLGVTLYEALTGDRAFPRGTDGDAYPQRSQPPSPFPGWVAPDVVGPIAACLAADPEDRPTARELGSRLEPLVAALPRRIILGRIRPSWR